MIITVTRNMFHDAFINSQYTSNFSNWALDELYDYLGDVEDSTGVQIEIDVCAIACEYTEMSYGEVITNYDTHIDLEVELIHEPTGDDYTQLRKAEDIISEVQVYLESNTTVVAHSGDTFLFANF